MTKILVLAHRVPEIPLRNGYDLHVHHVLDHLARLGMDLILVVPDRTGTDTPSEVPYGIEVASVTPASMAVFRRLGHGGFRLRGAVRRQVTYLGADILLVMSGKLACAVSGRSVPSILDAIDATHLNVEASLRMTSGLARIKHRLSATSIRRSMRIHYPRFDSVVAVTPEDARAIEAVVGGLAVLNIPNGVSVEAFASRGKPDRVPGRIIFTGAMDYPPNEAAAEFLANRVLPAVRERVSRAHLYLVGRDPSPRVLLLNDLADVTVTGEVIDMEPYLSSAEAFACAMVSGTGMKNKLLEAMANGLPCVITPLAAQGLGVEHGRTALVAEPEDFAQALVGVMVDSSLRTELGLAAHAYVVQGHSWSAVAERYVNLIASVLAASSQSVISNRSSSADRRKT